MIGLFEGQPYNPYNYLHAPSHCNECNRALKNKKKYRILGIAELKGGFWTILKQCIGCHTINIHEVSE